MLAAISQLCQQLGDAEHRRHAHCAPETDFTPLVFDRRGILLGWGRNFFATYSLRHASAALTINSTTTEDRHPAAAADFWRPSAAVEPAEVDTNASEAITSRRKNIMNPGG